MPEHNTRQSATERLEEVVQNLSQAHSTMNEKLESILDRLAMLAIPATPQTPPHPPVTHNPHLKLEVPRFDGQDPLGWIFKISQFFDYQGVPEQERLTVVSFYMEGPALSWYQWMMRNGFLTSWSAMLQALESRFAPSFYDNPHGALFKLLQRGSVNDYLTEFERLANRTVGLAPPFLLSCFISGLNPDLRREVQALQPMSLPQVVALVKLQEDMLQDRRKGPHPYTPPSSSFSPPNLSTNQSYTPSQHSTTATTPATPTLPLKYLSGDFPLRNWSSVVTGAFATTAMNSGPGAIAANHVSTCSSLTMTSPATCQTFPLRHPHPS